MIEPSNKIHVLAHTAASWWADQLAKGQDLSAKSLGAPVQDDQILRQIGQLSQRERTPEQVDAFRHQLDLEIFKLLLRYTKIRLDVDYIPDGILRAALHAAGLSSTGCLPMKTQMLLDKQTNEVRVVRGYAQPEITLELLYPSTLERPCSQ